MPAPIFSLEKLQKIYDFNNALARELQTKINDKSATLGEKQRFARCTYFLYQIDTYVKVS